MASEQGPVAAGGSVPLSLNRLTVAQCMTPLGQLLPVERLAQIPPPPSGVRSPRTPQAPARGDLRGLVPDERDGTIRRLTAVLSALFLSATSAAHAASAPHLKAKIGGLISATQYRQTIIGTRVTPTRHLYQHRKTMWKLKQDLRWWRSRATVTWHLFSSPPNLSAWLCIHRGEGSWSDSGDPYWGGLQMDRGFMSTYAPAVLLRRGYANRWSPLEQIWVAERARRSGRGFGPWPNTAKRCGLL